ncbi:zinc finger protein 184-like [Polypterus senegalus]|uniref:zinc finger protein 184-like n=1 Tax=Polypterus senegalus TaxID=55291 RepID=UPI001964F05A|nr:zinc finger protein 184-like [Polypterus senegalus]
MRVKEEDDTSFNVVKYEMKEMYQAAHVLLEKEHKYEEGVAKEGENTTIKADLHSVNTMEKRNLDIKEEDFEWEFVNFKEDSEQMPDSTAMQKYVVLDRIKEEDIKLEPELCPDMQVSAIASTTNRPCSLQSHSMYVKSESSESDLSENASCSNHCGKDLQGSAISSLSQTAPQKHDENMKKLTFDSESVIPAPFNYISVHVVDLVKSNAFNTTPQVQNQVALHIYQASGKSMDSKLNCKDNQQSHMRLNPYGCSECNKEFSNPRSLRNHKLIHIGKKPHCCSECGKQFSQKSYLQRHTRIHTGEIPYSCSECGKRFFSIRELQIHMRIHTGEKPHRCPECGKHFSQMINLKRHSRIHSGEKPHCCSQCDKRFSFVSSLNNHVRIHTGEKPYCCYECGRRFSQIGNLKKHTMIHTGEKPFACSECGKQFSGNDSLQKHTKIHAEAMTAN